jgi:predicted CoA-binding protein/GNAT superfamily N-acetyltransferase
VTATDQDRKLPPEAVDALLRDGRVVTVRPVRPEDRDALERLHAGASARNRYLRFFSTDDVMPRSYADHLATAGGDTIAVVAVAGDDVVAVASAEPASGADEPADEAEVALMVADGLHGAGAGTLLLEHLAAVAVDRGIRRFTAEVMAENGAMMRVFLHAGYRTRCGLPDHAVRTVELDLARTEDLAAAVAGRERAVDAASVARILEPRSVAVVGASRTEDGVGRQVLANILAGGFTGQTVVVNPHAERGDRIGGVSAYASATDVPWPLDLAVVAVPAARVAAALRDCGTAGVRAAVVLTSGFAETGDPTDERELVRIAHRHGMRLLGPNCLGVLNTDPAVRLNATFAAVEGFETGTEGVGLASQSGALGIAVLDAARRRGLPVADCEPPSFSCGAGLERASHGSHREARPVRAFRHFPGRSRDERPSDRRPRPLIFGCSAARVWMRQAKADNTAESTRRSSWRSSREAPAAFPHRPSPSTPSPPPRPLAPAPSSASQRL